MVLSDKKVVCLLPSIVGPIAGVDVKRIAVYARLGAMREKRARRCSEERARRVLHVEVDGA
jgi:hypothetical protein